MKKTLMKGVLTIMDIVKAIQEEVVSIYQTIKNIKKKNSKLIFLKKAWNVMQLNVKRKGKV